MWYNKYRKQEGLHIKKYEYKYLGAGFKNKNMQKNLKQSRKAGIIKMESQWLKPGDTKGLAAIKKDYNNIYARLYPPMPKIPKTLSREKRLEMFFKILVSNNK